MALIADGLLLAAAVVAAVYCHVLAGRLQRLKQLDGGVGQAIAALVAQVEEMRTALKAARAASGDSVRTLTERTARAEMAAGRLELLLAALHDREGSVPVDAANRRAERRRDGGAATGGLRGFRDRGGAAASLRLAPEPDALGEEDDALPVAAERVAMPGQPDRPARRLFRIDADPDAAPEDEAPGEVATEAAPVAPPRPAKKADAAALRAALEALARETSE